MPDLVAMSDTAIGRVRALEGAALALPQVDIQTDHVLHAGVYTRTVMVPAGVVITGVLVKIPTVVIVSGEAIVYGEQGAMPLSGYTVLQAAAGRKQAFVAVTDIHITMTFATTAKTVEEAEAEFTDEADLLVSRRNGSLPCQE